MPTEVLLDADNMDLVRISGSHVKMVQVKGIRECWQRWFNGNYIERKECDSLLLCVDGKCVERPWRHGAKLSLRERLAIGDFVCVTLHIEDEDSEDFQSAALPWCENMDFANVYVTTGADENGDLWLVCSKEFTADDVLDGKILF